MSAGDAGWIVARNPATGIELGRFPSAVPLAVAQTVARAQEAQADWSRLPWRDRAGALERLHRTLAADADGWAQAIQAEIGKPLDEASAEVITSLDAIRWTVRFGGRTLAERRLGPGWQRWLLVPSVRLRWRPLGVVGIIGTWNYPLLLSAPTIVQTLAAGNAVVWKPSELAASAGDRLQRAIEASGLPEGLVATVQGGSDVGQALIDADIQKLVFTGGVETGRRVLATAAARGIPALAELSGFDAAIVLPDAPFETTVRALCWAGFVGAGQTCIAVKRVYVVGDPTPWAEALAREASRLRVGDPALATTDVGPLIAPAARERFEAFVSTAIAAGARPVGTAPPGDWPPDGAFTAPVVLQADQPEPEVALAGVFGPVVLVRGVEGVEQAIEATNRSPYGLAASVWGRDRRRARAVAERLAVGMVSVNDAVASSAAASAPFGGFRASGFGRTKGPLGLLEFAQPQSLTVRSAGGFRPQLFPYRGRLARLLRPYRWLYHR